MSTGSEEVTGFYTGTIARIANNHQGGWIQADDREHAGQAWFEFGVNQRRRMCSKGLGTEGNSGDLLWKPFESLTFLLHDLIVRTPVVFELGQNGMIKSWGTRRDCIDAIASTWAQRYMVTPSYGKRKDACWMGLYIAALKVRVDLYGVFQKSHKGKLLWETRGNRCTPAGKLSNMFEILGNATITTLTTETQRVFTGWRAAL